MSPRGKAVKFFGVRTLATVVVTAFVGALALSGVSSAATAGADQGVTADSVKIGFIYSKTGAASATSGDSDVGCKARVGRENAAGGVNGRKIEVEYVDDQTSPGTNTTEAQDLVQNKHVFMVYNNSALAQFTYKWQVDSGVPSDRCRVRRHLLRGAREREHRLRVRERGAGERRQLHPHPDDREGAGRHEDGVARLRHLALVEFGGQLQRQVRGSCGRHEGRLHEHRRSTSAAPTSHRWCWASRTRARTRRSTP